MDMGSYYVNSLAPEIAQRYHEKLQLFCDNVDPYGLDTAHCSTAVADMPNVSAASISSYLKLSKCPYSGRAATNAGAGAGDSGGGGNEPPEPENCRVRTYVKSLDGIAIVLGEMQILDSGELLNPWFVAFPDGYVLCAHCTCAAGTNETCGHISGLLRNVLTLKAEQADREAAADAEANGADYGDDDESQLVAASVVKVKMEPIDADDDEARRPPPPPPPPVPPHRKPPSQTNGRPPAAAAAAATTVSVRQLNAVAASVAAKQRQQQLQQPTTSRTMSTVNSVAAAAAAVASLPKPIVLNFSNGMRKINIITAKTITSTSRINGIPVRTQMTSSDGTPINIVPAAPAAAPATAAAAAPAPAAPPTATTATAQVKPKPILWNGMPVLIKRQLKTDDGNDGPVRTFRLIPATANSAARIVQMMPAQQPQQQPPQQPPQPQPPQSLQQQQQSLRLRAHAPTAAPIPARFNIVHAAPRRILPTPAAPTRPALAQPQPPPLTPMAATATTTTTAAPAMASGLRIANVHSLVPQRRQRGKTRPYNTAGPPVDDDSADDDQRSGGGGGGAGAGTAKRARIKLYVCGICTAQFGDKISFMQHCQCYHALPEGATAGPMADSIVPPAPVAGPVLPPPRKVYKPTYAQQQRKNSQMAALRQLRRLMRDELARPERRREDEMEQQQQQLEAEAGVTVKQERTAGADRVKTLVGRRVEEKVTRIRSADDGTAADAGEDDDDECIVIKQEPDLVIVDDDDDDDEEDEVEEVEDEEDDDVEYLANSGDEAPVAAI